MNAQRLSFLPRATLLAAGAGLAPRRAEAVNPGPPDRGFDAVGENLFGDAVFGASETTVDDGAGVLLRADPEVLPAGFDPGVQFVSLAGTPPNPIVEGGVGVEATINEGLVQALDLVGETLFGAGAFGASLRTVDDGAGNALPAVQLDLQINPGPPDSPALVDIFATSPDPPVAPTYFQVEVGPAGVFLRADPAALPEGFDPVIEFSSLLFSAPEPCAVETEQ